MSISIIILAILFLTFLFLGVPLALCVGFSALIVLITTMDTPIVIVIQRMFTQYNSFTLMAIPLFILTGQLMNRGGITRRIILLSDTLIGHIRGGLSHVNVLASMLFAGVSGSAMADAAGIGAILIPAMKEDGYEDDWAVVVTAASSALGPIIPPSILMVIYGSVTNLSIGRLFLANLLPGILIGIVQIVLGYFLAIRRGRGKTRKRASFNELLQALKKGWPPLLAPIIIIVGITSGVFTPTEAGGAAVLYSLLLCVIYKELDLKTFFDVLLEAAKASAMVYFIIGCSSVFGAVITLEHVPQQVLGGLTSLITNPTVLFLIVVAIMVIIGLFIDATTAIIIFIPFLFPLASQYGIDPYQFAAVIVVTMMIGGITPPVGCLLYVTCGVSKTPIKKVLRLSWVFVFAMLLVVLLMVFVPEITTLIPNLML